MANEIMQVRSHEGETDPKGFQALIASQPQRRDRINRKALESEPDAIRSREGDIAPSVEHSVREALRGGRPLTATERTFFESRMGVDLRDVRVSDHAAAAQSAAKLSSRAYTLGNQIVLGHGEYDFGTERGKWLMAHELVHTLQQKRAAQKRKRPKDQSHYDARSNRLATGQRVDQRVASTDHETVQRGLTAGAGLAISAGAFALSLAPDSNGGLSYTNATMSFSRAAAGNKGRTVAHDLMYVGANFSGGYSWATWRLNLTTDGDSIISANTEFGEIHGFSGGTLGSTGSIRFGATKHGGERDRPLRILVTFSGHLNPTGFGYCNYTGSVIISGDGTIERQVCRVTNVSGNVPATYGVDAWGSGYQVRGYLRSERQPTEHPSRRQ